jgi:NAD-dependent deacetylase
MMGKLFYGGRLKMKNIVILTGAGISAESGLQTFRAADGLWHGHKIDDVATPEAYARDPKLVNEFYNARRRQIQEAIPNQAHIALARLAKEWRRGEVLIVTQNVDDLHDRAAKEAGVSGHLIHLHGEILKARCTKTNFITEWHDDILPDTVSPFDKTATLRPHIVWFGEMPLGMDEIYKALLKSSIFLSIGTSGNVHPASSFVEIAKRTGAHTVEFNIEPSVGNNLFDETRIGKASETVPAYVDELLRNE